jgi:putative membrane protein
MEKEKKDKYLLVICVDVDNDLEQKTGIKGPVIGRDKNFEAATKLMLADPEEEDANTMFAAIKVFDEIYKTKKNVEIVTLTGAPGSYTAGFEIGKQLDSILENIPADSCIFISDGASDQTVLPIIQSRLKIESIKVVSVKQAKGVEATYITLLEKLKEPHFARIFFGIPALILLLITISYIFGYGLLLPGIVLGVYLLIKGFGIEDTLIRLIKSFAISTKRVSFGFYLLSLIILFVALAIGISSFYTYSNQGEMLAIGYGLKDFLSLLGFVLLFFGSGKLTDIHLRKQELSMPRMIFFLGSLGIAWFDFYALSLWIIAKIYFYQLIESVLLSVVVLYLIHILTTNIAKKILKEKRIIGKEVIDKTGAKVGKISGISLAQSILKVETSFKTIIEIPFENIISIGEKIVVEL